jgi:hypothetical protein
VPSPRPGAGRLMPAKSRPHQRGSDSARRYGREPKVHYRGDGDVSLCGRSSYGPDTADPVDCKLCLDIAYGKRRPA